ncbi:MAG: hypothetical protein WKG07_27205 [Hymenobacter sp.]
MYWKDVRAGYYWREAPTETQATLIEAFDEIKHDQKSVDEMKLWLLTQKQTQQLGKHPRHCRCLLRPAAPRLRLAKCYKPYPCAGGERGRPGHSASRLRRPAPATTSKLGPPPPFSLPRAA